PDPFEVEVDQLPLIRTRPPPRRTSRPTPPKAMPNSSAIPASIHGTQDACPAIEARLGLPGSYTTSTVSPTVHGSLVLTPEVNRWVSPSTRNSTTGVYMVVPERSCLLRRELSRSTWVDTSTTVPSACGQSERSACRTHSIAAMLPRITSSAMPIARKMVPTVRLLGGSRIGPGGCGTWSVMIPPRVLPDVCRKRRRSESAADQALGEVALHLVQRHPLLGHRVTLPYRHGLILEGVEVDRDAVRRAYLVLAPVAPADRLRVVELDVPVLAQGGSEVTGLRRQVLVARQRQHGGLHRCQPWVELQHGPL